LKIRWALRTIKAAVVLSLLVSALTGCYGNTPEPTANSKESNQNSSGMQSAQKGPYPINTKDSFSYWGTMSTTTASFYTNQGDSEYGKEVEKRTGVKVKWMTPQGSNINEAFNLMIASGSLPDAIEYNWASVYPGGPEKALQDGVIMPLNELIDKYAPNLKKALLADPSLDKMVKTDSGKYYAFPMIRPQSSLVYKGPMIRKDWLDELGLDVPSTIDEWYTVLKAFKDKKGAQASLTLIKNSKGPDLDSFVFGAYKVGDNFYVDDNNKVQYGPMMPGFKEGLKTLSKWYSEGLLDRDFSINDVKALDNKMLNSKSGATHYLLTTGIARYLDIMKEKNPYFDLVGAPYPTLSRGEKPFIGQTDFTYLPNYASAISTRAKNPELIVKWLDYFYSPEGIMLNNYGVENVTYKLQNGIVLYTDLVDNNSDKLARGQVLSKFTKVNGPTILDDKYAPPPAYKQQEDAYHAWSNTDALKHRLPPFITPTVEEGKELAKVITALESLRTEMLVKMIMGAESTDDVDKYTKKMKEIGVDQVLDIYQKALARYYRR
jgi:putative aldouronate transport system substrate-binding protein